MNDDFELDEALKEFLVESTEYTDKMEQNLLSLENNPNDIEVINDTFRALHTIKGNSGFLCYKSLEKLSHSSETLLDLLRNSELSFNSDLASILLDVVDEIRGMLSNIETDGTDGGGDHTELVARIDAAKSA